MIYSLWRVRVLFSVYRKVTSFNLLHLNLISEKDGHFVLSLFDIRYLRQFSSAQNKKSNSYFSPHPVHAFPANTVGFAIFITNKVPSVNSEGQRLFDSIIL